jgi:LysM repeat protein
MTTQQYDANGFLVSVTDPSRAEGNRTFVNDGAGRALLVNQGGGVQRQLVVNGEVLGIYGVGLDPTAIGQVGGNASFANVADFNFGYSKVTGAYPSATPGAYHVRPGDTLQSIAQSAYGDSKLWYRIADANGLASSSDLKVGQTLNIPSGVGTISNNAGTFKPYDGARITGDLNPLALPPAGRDADCGGMGKLVMVAVAVAVTYWTGRVDAVKAFWATAFKTVAAAETAAAMATVATAATAAAAGSAASQAVGMLTGDVKSFSWQSVALSAISGGVTQGLGGANPMIEHTFVRAAVANALSQGIGVVTGLQQRFDWRGVVASYVGSAVGQVVGDVLGLPVDGTRGDMSRGDFLLRATMKGVAAGIATAVARGGRVAVQQVAVNAFGAALPTALEGSADASAPAEPTIEDLPTGMDLQSDQYTRTVGWPERSVVRLPSKQSYLVAHPSHDPLVSERHEPSDPSVEDAIQTDIRLRSGRELAFKPPEHYAIAMNALREASRRLGANAISLEEVRDFLTGTQWPDFPTSGVGRATDTANPLAFGLRFKFAERFPDTARLLASDFGFADLGLTQESHFGTLQYLHAMTPDSALTNRQVRDLLVDKLVQRYVYASNSDRPMFYIGTMGHPVADSYSDSHTIRGIRGIQQFQDFNAQEQRLHGEADHVILNSTTGNSRYPNFADIPRIKISIEQNAMLIIMHKQNASPAEVLKYLSEEVFRLDPRYADRKSGGSAPEFAKPGANVYYPNRP